MDFELQIQEEACKSKPFPRARKVTLPNGLVIRSRWYEPPKIEKRTVPVNPDVRLPNGIVLRATTYRLPSLAAPPRSKEEQAKIDWRYRQWKAAKDGCKYIDMGIEVHVVCTNGRQIVGRLEQPYRAGEAIKVRPKFKGATIITKACIKSVEVVL